MRRTIAYERAEEPATVDEAIERRNALIADVQKIQAQLGRIDGDPEWRRSAIHALNTKQGELRRIKDWLRRHDDHKTSEWQLLGKAHRLMDEIVEGGFLDANASDAPALATELHDRLTALLDEIEKTVPGKYLEVARGG